MIENLSFFKKQAVTSIVGVILLIIITVVVAAVIWLWVSAIIGGGAKATPTVEMKASKEDRNYTVRISDVSREVDIDKIEVFILKGGVSEYRSVVSDYEIYGNNTEDCKIALWDVNLDKALSVGDCFVLRGKYARSGITIRLIHKPTDGIMGELTL